MPEENLQFRQSSLSLRSPLHYFVLHPVLPVCCVVDTNAARKGSLSGAGEQFDSYKLFSVLATAIMFLIPL